MDSNVELTSEQGANLWIDLRAAAVIACERISKASNAEFSAIDLGFFFHQMGRLNIGVMFHRLSIITIDRSEI